MFPGGFRPSGMMRRFPTFSGPFSSGVRVGLPLISPRVFTRRSPFMSSIDPYTTIRPYALRSALGSAFPYTASAPVMGPVSLGIPGYTSGFAPYTNSAPRLTGPIAAGVSRYTPGVGAFSPISRLTPTLGGVSSLGPALSIGVSSSLGSGTSVGPLLSASGFPTSIGSTPRISPLISASGLGTSIGSTPSISPLISVSSLPVSPAVSAGSAGLETSYLIDTGPAPIRTSGVTLEPVGIIDESGRYRAFDRSAVGTTGLSVALSGGRMASGGSPLNRNSELALGTTSFGLGTQRPVVSVRGIDSMGIGVDGGAGIRYSEIGDASGLGSVNRLNNLNTLNRDASLGGSFSTGPSSIVTTGAVASTSPLRISYNARNTIGEQYNLPATGASSFNGRVDVRSLNAEGFAAGTLNRGGFVDGSGVAAGSLNRGGFVDGSGIAAGSLNRGGIVDGSGVAAGSLNSGGFVHGSGVAAGSLNRGVIVDGSGVAASNLHRGGFVDGSGVAAGNLNNVGNLNRGEFVSGSGVAAGNLNNVGNLNRGEFVSGSGVAAGNRNNVGNLNRGGFVDGSAVAAGNLNNVGNVDNLYSGRAVAGRFNSGGFTDGSLAGGSVAAGLNSAGMNSLRGAGLNGVSTGGVSLAGGTNAGTFGGVLRDTAFMNGGGAVTSGLASDLSTRMDPAGPARMGSFGSTGITSSEPTYLTDVNTIGLARGATGGGISGSATFSGRQPVGQGLVDVGRFADPAQAGGVAVDVRVVGGQGAEIVPGIALGPGSFAGKSRNSGPLSQDLGAATLGTRPNIIHGGPPGRSVVPAESTPV